ncbi:hypothetical protein [Chroococcidiopsis sp. CCMEE 29]|uniref:hypothetical protein n=1 Tax=Chroococcidiopsis sp. CCMEE 29 TaxID=155894 RepID=UPI0020211191|nr:hypothetical protein [Chroococcidiopsis sp. CCMEE 29]
MFSYLDALTGSYLDESTSGSRFDGWSLEERDPRVIQSLLPLGEWLYRCWVGSSSILTNRLPHNFGFKSAQGRCHS